MTENVGGGRWARLGTAVALAAAALFLSAFNGFSLILFPLAVVLVVLPTHHRMIWLTLGTILWLIGIWAPGGPLDGASQFWALALAGGYGLATLVRLRWGVLPRSLLGVTIAMAAGAIWLVITGGWAQMDAMVRDQMLSASAAALSRLQLSGADSAVVAEFGKTVHQVTMTQWKVFPALLGLQSLAALALVSWAVAWLRRDEERAFRLRPMREFRFNDQLVWVLVLGLVLLVLPLGALAARMGYNALLFMGGLYALRGLGVFIFLVGAAPSVITVLFGIVAIMFLYPVVLTAAVLVGLGDTWLDVRRRAAKTPPG